MESNDPFKRYVATPESPAANIFVIVPSDTADLARGVKAVRIFNSLDEIAFIRVLPLAGEEPITLAVPPLTIIWEQVRLAKVFATGTEPTLAIHGYTD